MGLENDHLARLAVERAGRRYERETPATRETEMDEMGGLAPAILCQRRLRPLAGAGTDEGDLALRRGCVCGLDGRICLSRVRRPCPAPHGAFKPGLHFTSLHFNIFKKTPKTYNRSPFEAFVQLTRGTYTAEDVLSTPLQRRP